MVLDYFASQEVLLPLLIGVVAFLYSGVGHGGASGYIAVMILLGMTPSTIRPQALALNCLVSAISFIAFRRVTELDKKVFIPLCLASVPAAFLGGAISLPDNSLNLILGILLLVPVFRLMEITGNKREEVSPKYPGTIRLVLVGLWIGLLSGMIGIGGGILLSPLFLIMGWSRPKPVAALSALFIFVNSLSGLAAQFLMKKPDLFSSLPVSHLFLATIGGVLGGTLGSGKLNSLQLKRLLAIVILIASIKLIIS